MTKYFIYSEEQKLFRKNFDSKIGKFYHAGRVKIDGKWREFTDIAADDSLSGVKYQDAEVVGFGDINILELVYPKSSYNNKLEV